MRMLLGSVAVCIALALCGVAPGQAKAKKVLVGKWQATQKVNDKEVTVFLEFTKDGKLTTKSGPVTLTRTYKVIDDSNIEVTVKVGTKSTTSKIKIKIDKDELEMTPENGKTMKLKRVTKSATKD